MNREYPREPVLWDARWNAMGRLESGHVLDINPAGAFVATSRADGLAPGMRVQLSFVIPETGRERRMVMNLGAVVRWVGRSSPHERAGFGVAFDEVQLLLGALLCERDPREVLGRLAAGGWR